MAIRPSHSSMLRKSGQANICTMSVPTCCTAESLERTETTRAPIAARLGDARPPSSFSSTDMALSQIPVRRRFKEMTEGCQASGTQQRSEEHTYELTSLMRNHYAGF